MRRCDQNEMEEKIGQEAAGRSTDCAHRLLMFVDEKIFARYHSYNLQFRRNSSSGVWMSALVPLALVTGALYYPNCSALYKTTTVASLGFMIHSVCDILLSCLQEQRDHSGTRCHYLSGTPIVPFSYLVCYLYTYLTVSELKVFRGSPMALPLYEIFCALYVACSYRYCFYEIVFKCPFSFTYGEATTVTQSVLLFVLTFISNVLDRLATGSLPSFATKTSFIVQCVFFAVFFFVVLLAKVPTLTRPVPFLVSFALSASFFIVTVPWFLIRENVLLWTFRLLTSDPLMLPLLCCWLLCSLFAVVGVMIQVRLQSKASTAVRKYFHVLIVIVYGTGLLVNPAFLYFASAVAFALMALLEISRVLKMPFVGQHLQSGFIAYADEKDDGPIALTPFYLLIGCSAPIWLYPSTVRKPIPLSVLSGILTIGVGDTFASLIGMRFGTHKWAAGCEKSIEGSLSSFAAQMVCLAVFYLSRQVKIENPVAAVFVVLVTTVMEAKTEQIDNLALPLFAYSLFYY